MGRTDTKMVTGVILWVVGGVWWDFHILSYMLVTFKKNENVSMNCKYFKEAMKCLSSVLITNSVYD